MRKTKRIVKGIYEFFFGGCNHEWKVVVSDGSHELSKCCKCPKCKIRTPTTIFIY